MNRWYDDKKLLDALPLRYRAYAVYSRLVGSANSRHVPGGSFMLRLIRDASSLTGTTTVAHVHGIDGLTVVTDFADERVLEVIHEIRGENAEYRVMRSLLSPGSTFVDVGANFGTFALLASRIVGPSGRVIAIEPQQRLASFIEESLSLSGVGNCDVKQLAVGTQDRVSSLLVPVDDSGRAGFFPEFSGRREHRAQEVSVTTLDRVLADCQPTMIKIDVEGSEMDVFDGAERTISRSHPALMIEINPWSAEAAGRSTKEIIARLESLGYSSFANVNDYPATVDPRDLALDKQTNIVATA